MRQMQPAIPASSAEATRGLEIVQYRCGSCHLVRGTLAGARSAPDLTHLMSRRTIAAGAAANDPGNLAAWIEAPQSLKPGSLMPNQSLPADELVAVLAYLRTLQ
jgi:cytochrome c oxidase subunit II